MNFRQSFEQMLFKNSIKQIFRTRIRTIAFLALLTLAVTFLSLGVNLWLSCSRNMREYEKVFTTIGVVDQKENSMKVTAQWDPFGKEYTYWNEPVYDSFIPVSVLDFKGADYIVPPKQRPYYCANSPGLRIHATDFSEQLWRYESVVEFTPYEDCTPSEPVKVKITKTHWGYRKAGEDIWFCDVSNENPGMLEAGKKYIATTFSMTYSYPDDPKYRTEMPCTGTGNVSRSTQRSKDGEKIPMTYKAKESWDEVDANFYQSEAWDKWNGYIQSLERWAGSLIPVIPADKTMLLMEFHQGQAAVYQGRDIRQEEYEAGEKVCLIPQRMAARNELKVGDSIQLQLYYANYKNSASLNYYPSETISMDFSFLNAEGKDYPVFEDSTYKIVGIYSGNSQTEKPSGYEIGSNVVIIPSKSVKNSDENNIVDYGPMKGYATAFQIPNGTSKAYMEKFNALGMHNIEITFYDGGYEEMASGMRNLQLVSMILVFASLITTLSILLFFVHLFVDKQKKRTAIERSLGMSKKQCIESMLYGILGITSIATVFGSLSGSVINIAILSAHSNTGEQLYNTAFSNWVNHADKAAKLGAAMGIGLSSVAISVLLALFIILASLGLTYLFVRSNLKAEPLALLSKNED